MASASGSARPLRISVSRVAEAPRLDVLERDQRDEPLAGHERDVGAAGRLGPQAPAARRRSQLRFGHGALGRGTGPVLEHQSGAACGGSWSTVMGGGAGRPAAASARQVPVAASRTRTAPPVKSISSWRWAMAVIDGVAEVERRGQHQGHLGELRQQGVGLGQVRHPVLELRLVGGGVDEEAAGVTGHAPLAA